MLKTNLKYITLLIILGIFFLLDIYLGSVKIPISEISKSLIFGKSSNETWDLIIWDFRLPKAIVAIFAGMGLSVAGLQMQTIFRNPLAGPYVLGISSGASLGVAFLFLGFTTIFPISMMDYLGNWAVVFSAWIGAAMVLFLILSVSFRIKDIMTILILGIMFGSISSSIISILEYFSHEIMLKKYVIWMMGSLVNVSKSQLEILILSVVFGLIISIFLTKKLNILLMGENYAKTIGVNVKRTQYLVFISVSILAGTITAFCGPIGFIGIAVPHVARMFFNTSDHKHLIFGSAIIGAIVMLLSDIISQMPGSNSVLPINAVTSLIGIPIIIWIVVKNHKMSSSI